MKEEMNRQAEGQLSGHVAVAEPPDRGVVPIDLLSTLWAKRGLLLLATLGGGLVSAVVAFLLPTMYTATAVIMPPRREQSSAALMIGQLGPLAAAAGADLGLKNPDDMYLGLLGSRTIADHLIQQFGLKTLYHKETLIDTRKKLKKRSHFIAGRDSLIVIDVDDTDPRRAAEMANAFVAQLDLLDRKLAAGEAGDRRQFLEKQVTGEKAALASAEEAMKNAQQQSGMIEVTTQTQVAIVAIAQLRAQIASAEVALQRLKMGATVDNPMVVQAETELTAMRNELHRLEKSPSGGDPMVPTSAIPEAGLTYMRRLRDLKYHETLFELLSKQYEAARLDEIKASPPIQVVDTAVPPDKKSGPLRALIIALGCMIGAGVPVTLAYVEQRPEAESIFPARRIP